MATPRRDNNEGKGTAEEAAQADGNNNVAEDGSEDDIVLEGPTLTDVFSMEPLRNGEWFGVHEGGPRNGDSFAGLSQHPPTLPGGNPHSGLSARNLVAINRGAPHDPLGNWLHSPDDPITELLCLLSLREERARPQSRPTTKKRKHEPQQRK